MQCWPTEITEITYLQAAVRLAGVRLVMSGRGWISEGVYVDYFFNFQIDPVILTTFIL